MKIRIFLLVGFSCFAGLFACDVEDCISTKTGGLKVEFYSSDRDTVYLVRGISAFSEGNEPKIIEESDSLFSIFPFDLDPASDSTNYNFNLIVEVNDSTTASYDSLYFHAHYRRNQRVISVECGVEQAFNNVEITDHNFDSIKIVHPNIERFDTLNVRVYF